MIWRVVGSILAVFLLVGYRLLSKARGAQAPAAPDSWNLPALLLASALTLFAELALIRWIATEVRIFAYVKNLALLLCFLGFGLGCALARQNPRWLTATKALLGLLVIVRLPWYSERVLENLSRLLGSSPDVEMWAPSVHHWGLFVLAAALTAVLLLLITYAFIPLGQTVSRQLELAPRVLAGYSWNLAASLIGILVFFAVSYLGLPPWVWFLMVLASIAILQTARRDRILLALAIVPAVLLLIDPSSPHRFTLWTPYQQIAVEEITFPNGELRATNVRVNHVGYQIILNLSHDFLLRHPGLLQEAEDENMYNLPFRFASANPRVLIVGSGTGNDVAGALRNHSRSVDAVEIDPAILRLGGRHPEHPYEDPRVSAHLTDARAFLKRTSGPYDLILFGLLDSHTQVSDYSNMRIDNFVYTEESFREARALLAPGGILFVKFWINYRWLGRRFDEMLTDTFGKSPTVFTAPSSLHGNGTVCFAISSSDQIEQKLAADSRLRQFVDAHQPPFLDLPPVPITTDDWPYLYQKGHTVPGVFSSLSVLVVLLAISFYLEIPEARSRIPSLFFFSMGAGFLLLETQVVSRLALYFGTTWQVNGIVIAAILAALLLANYVTEKLRQPLPRSWNLALLLFGIVIAYVFPFQRLPGSAAAVGTLAAFVFAIPVFFAGLLFAAEFRAADSPAAALGANMLGAVVGGLLENASLVVGMKALLVFAALLYLLAGVGFRGLRPRSSPTQG